MVGRLSIVFILTGSLLLGSAALAQQGMIIEPWRPVSSPPALPAAPAVPASPALPASGLEPAPTPGLTRVEPAPALPAPAPVEKWSPPVVELLVDPWAKHQQGPSAPRPRWVPPTIEIVDPWAELAPPPRIAVMKAPSERSTIF